MNDQITNNNSDIDKFNSLPKEIRNVIYSGSTTKTIESIGKKYQLHLDKINSLLFAVEDVMMGDIRADDFISHIKKELEIDQETANKIGGEIDQQVFESVRDAIKSLSQPKVETVPESTTSLPVVTETTPKPTIADIKTKEKTSSPVQEKNYTLDPYREPIE